MSLLILNQRKLIENRYDQWLDDLPQKSTLFSTSEKGNREFINEIKHEFAHAKTYEDYPNSARLLFDCDDVLETQSIKRIVSISEVDILRAAELRGRHKLEGQTIESALDYRDKLRTKEKVRGAKHFRLPDFQPVHGPLEALNFAKQYGFPFVLKPRASAGSVGVEVISSVQALELYFTQVSQSEKLGGIELLAEEFVDGEMFHVDGLILNGKVCSLRSSRYLNGCLSFRQGQPLGSLMLDSSSELAIRLELATEEVISRLVNPIDAAFHAEFFHTASGELVFCEIASRAGGAGVSKAFEVATGIHLNREAARAQAGLPFSPIRNVKVSKISGWMVFPPRPGVLKEIPLTCPFEFVEQYSVSAEPLTDLKPAKNSVDQLAQVVIRAGSEEEGLRQLRQLESWFYRHLEIIGDAA